VIARRLAALACLATSVRAPSHGRFLRIRIGVANDLRRLQKNQREEMLVPFSQRIATGQKTENIAVLPATYIMKAVSDIFAPTQFAPPSAIRFLACNMKNLPPFPVESYLMDAGFQFR
jgi:hypothetical protein